jgi:hypothetical protein
MKILLSDQVFSINLLSLSEVEGGERIEVRGITLLFHFISPSHFPSPQRGEGTSLSYRASQKIKAYFWSKSPLAPPLLKGGWGDFTTQNLFSEQILNSNIKCPKQFLRQACPEQSRRAQDRVLNFVF